MSKKTKAFALFAHGFKPGDPEVKSLGLKPKSRYNYFQEWKKTGVMVAPEDGGKQPQKSEHSIEKTIIPAQAVQLKADVPGVASILKLVPVAITCPLTPIMQNARLVAEYELGWPHDMPWEDFIDTCLYHLFKAWGFTIQGYIIDAQVEDTESGNTSPILSPEEPGESGEKINIHEIAVKIAPLVLDYLNQQIQQSQDIS